MKVYVKCNIEDTCRAILGEQLDRFGIRYTLIGSGCVQFEEVISMHTYQEFITALQRYNIHILDNNKTLLVEKIKAVVIALYRLNKLPLIKMSSYLEEKLGTSYRTLAKSFVEVCHMSIEEYIIRYKIERAKEMLVNEFLTLTEIAHTLHYSSVAHLSNQFKKVTGFCPKEFQGLMQYKRINTA